MRKKATSKTWAFEECQSSRPTSFRAAPNSFRATFGALPNRRRGPSKIGGMGHTMCVPNPGCAPGPQSAANEIHSADGSICPGWSAREDGHPCVCGSIFSRGSTCSRCGSWWTHCGSRSLRQNDSPPRARGPCRSSLGLAWAAGLTAASVAFHPSVTKIVFFGICKSFRHSSISSFPRGRPATASWACCNTLKTKRWGCLGRVAPHTHTWSAWTEVNWSAEVNWSLDRIDNNKSKRIQWSKNTCTCIQILCVYIYISLRAGRSPKVSFAGY